MSKGPGENGNGGNRIVKLVPPDQRPTLADAGTAGLDKPEMVVALMRGRLQPLGTDELLCDDIGPDMTASRRIISPDGEFLGIGSLREIEKRILGVLGTTGTVRKSSHDTEE